MKIEYETKDVKIVRYRTPAEALASGFRAGISGSLSRIVLDTLYKGKPAEVDELAEALREPLWREYEGEKTYERTLALISLSREMEIREFYQKLNELESGYYPASLSEGMSYLPVLAKDGVQADVVIHLGTSFRDEEYHERRLLTKKNGSAELVAFYPATRLKPHYKLIVVKREKKQPPPK